MQVFGGMTTMNYQLEDVKNMRGFDALTQSERRLKLS